MQSRCFDDYLNAKTYFEEVKKHHNVFYIVFMSIQKDIGLNLEDQLIYLEL